MKRTYHYVFPSTGQTVELTVEIDEDALAEAMVKRCVLNTSGQTQLLWGAIKGSITKQPE